jgi:hypothetical protein
MDVYKSFEDRLNGNETPLQDAFILTSLVQKRDHHKYKEVFYSASLSIVETI